MQASGRIAVRVSGPVDRSFSANFELEGTPRAGQLTLSTPFGTRLAQANWQPNRAWLRVPEGVREYDDAEQLAEQAMGERLPLPALFDWLAGRPWPAMASQALPAPQQGFEQMGWTVRLDNLADGLLTVSRSTPNLVTVRAKLDAPPSPTAVR